MAFAGCGFAFRSAQLWYRAIRSRKWSIVQATVAATAVKARRVPLGDEFEPVVEYEYIVDGHQYRGHYINLMFGTFPSYPHAHAKAIVQQYPAGTDVPVFYDPNNPQLVVLDRRFPKREIVVRVLTAAGFLLWTLFLVSFG